MQGYHELKSGQQILTFSPYDEGQDRIVSEQGYHGLGWLLMHINEGQQVQFNDRLGNPVAFLLRYGNAWKVVKDLETDVQATFNNRNDEFNGWHSAFWYGVSYMDRRKDVPSDKEYQVFKRDNIVVEYYYELKLRPFCHGTQPDGYVRLDNPTNYEFGTLVYNRMLTQQEIDHFSLEPVAYNPYVNRKE